MNSIFMQVLVVLSINHYHQARSVPGKEGHFLLSVVVIG